MTNVTDAHAKIEIAQKAFCRERGLAYIPAPPAVNSGCALSTKGRKPINGLRHPPERGTTGWYIRRRGRAVGPMEEMRIAQEILKTLKETTQSELFCDLAHRAEPIILATREFTMICDLAQLYRERGLWREGEYVLQAAVKFEPSQPDPHRALGLLFLHRDDLPWEQSLKRAVEAFETSVRLERLTSESSPATHSLLGRALFALGQADRAETELRNALRIDPEYAEAKYNLATVLSSLENPPLTMIHDLLSQCTRDDPDYAPAFR